jgi:deoxyhypusine synthase
MKKVIKLKESDIQRIVKRTLNEQDYGDKETVKNELLERIISEIVTTLEFSDQMGFDGKLTYSDIGEVLQDAFSQTEFLFSNEL